MKQPISQPARRRATNDTGYGTIVDPGGSGESTGHVAHMVAPLSLGILFAGGGVFSADLAPGCHVAWAVEYDGAVAAVHAMNHPGALTIVQGVEYVDYSTLPQVDILQASPECKEFSAAKTNGAESETQLGQARAICRALRALRPRGFILENVRGYIGSESLKMIGHTLYELDYCMDQQVVNSADYGVPQTRERLIVRARAGGFMGMLPPIPGRVQTWRGWYQAIEDLLPTLPESRFAAWQLKRLATVKESFLVTTRNAAGEVPPRGEREPAFATGASDYKNWPRAFIVSNAATEYGDGVRSHDAPMFGVPAQSSGRARAFLLGVVVTHQERGDGVQFEDEPAMTIRAGHAPRAFIVDGKLSDSGAKLQIIDAQRPSATVVSSLSAMHDSRAWLTTGRVVAMTPRALARFQSIPDSFILPDKRSLAATVVGNGVPSLLGRLLVESLRYE